MKKYGHTGTLFIKGGKYNWSYKYENCVECRTVKFKHKGNGLCSSCYDKYRKKRNPKRKFNLYKQSWMHYYRQRILLFLEKKEHKKRGTRKKSSYESVTEYKRQHYLNNKEVNNLVSKANRMRKKGIKCLMVNINGRERYFPFEGIPAKPVFTSSKFPEYERIRREYDILYKYYSGVRSYTIKNHQRYE